MRRLRVNYANTYQQLRRLWFLLIIAGVVTAFVIGWWL
ncbi:1,4-beta-N-acetylmuramidase, partial [Lactobacillus rhamnosus]|nr:1,4-beta-N-acetylmuramidase [Lacticaseibacillus rhamnosus]